MLIKPIEKSRSTSTRHLRISNSSLGISNGVSEDTDIHAAWPNKPGVTMVHLGNEKVRNESRVNDRTRASKEKHLLCYS